MKLSGNLQNYYDVLDEMGILEPLLKSDWGRLNTLKTQRHTDLDHLIEKLNHVSSEKEQIKRQLISFDSQVIQFFAMEVAKEYAEFHSAKQRH